MLDAPQTATSHVKPPKVGTDRASIITDVREAIKALEYCHEIGIDLETGGLNPVRDPIAVVSLAGDNGKIAILHIRGNMPPMLRDFLNEKYPKRLPEDIPEDEPENKKPLRVYIGHNITNFDIPFLMNNGVYIENWFDTLTVEAMLNTTDRQGVSKSLKATVARRLGKDVPKTIGKHSWMKLSLTDEELQYCVDDVIYLVQLKKEHIQRAIETKQTGALRVELQVAPAVSQMIFNGLPVNKDRLSDYLSRQREVANELLPQILDVFNPLGIPLPKKQTNVNIDSPKQVKECFKKLGVEVSSTDKEHLHELTLDDDPTISHIAQLLLDYKYANQRIKMYGTLLDNDNPFMVDGRLRCKFWQCGTGTGRFSSSEYNLQQVPVDMRDVFGWLDGHKMVSVDYAAIEVRVAAVQAKDEVLIRALQNEDVHRMVGAILFHNLDTFNPDPLYLNYTLSLVTKDQRQRAKAAVFCLIFGGGAGTLQRYAKMYGLTLTLSECKDIIKRFFTRFKGLAAMRSRAYERADLANGKALTVTIAHGLVRHLVGKAATATRLLNTAVQGTAAAGMKYALIYAHNHPLKLTQYIGATVHDELVAVVPDELVDEVGTAISECMINGMYRVVPRTVDFWVTDKNNKRILESVPVPIITGSDGKLYNVGDSWPK